MAVNVIKIGGISGYNSGDKIISDCLNYLLEKDGINIENINITQSEKTIHPKDYSVIASNSVEKKSIIVYFKKIVRYVFLTKLNFIYYIISIIKTLLIDGIYLLKKKHNYDFIIYGGGNLLFNQNGCHYLFSAWMISRIFNKKKMILWGVGVGPFMYPYKFQLKQIANNSKLLLVRDNESFGYFVKAPNVIKSYDPAYIVSDIKAIHNPLKEFIGFNVMDFSQSNLYSNQDIEKLSNNIAEIAYRLKLKIKIITSSISDIYLASEVIQRMSLLSPLHCHITNINDLPNIYGDIKYFISHRMHPSIFSLSYGIPTVIYPWQQKISSMMVDIFEDKKLLYLLEDVNYSPDDIINKLHMQENIDWYTDIIRTKETIYEHSNMIINTIKK